MSGLAWRTTARMPSAAVPTANETKAAFTGEPAAVIIFALVGACRAVAASPMTTAIMASRVGFMGSGYQSVMPAAPEKISPSRSRVARCVSSGRACGSNQPTAAISPWLVRSVSEKRSMR